MGARGDATSREVQPAWSEGAPFSSATFQAAMALAVGASSQRVPAESCQVESVLPPPFALETAVEGAAASTRWMRPSLVAAATRILSLYSKITGDDRNAAPAL